MNVAIQTKFARYPQAARKQLEIVHGLILDVAIEYNLGPVEESLKWGEASYFVKGGSPIRIDWKPKAPHVISVLFHCQTKLIETFREIYQDEFQFEGRRSIVIPLTFNIETSPLSHCIQLALQYHKLKHLPLLGA